MLLYPTIDALSLRKTLNPLFFRSDASGTAKTRVFSPACSLREEGRRVMHLLLKGP